MRENKPVLLVLSAYDGEIILEKGEILSEKRQKPLALIPLLKEIIKRLDVLFKRGVHSFFFGFVFTDEASFFDEFDVN